MQSSASNAVLEIATKRVQWRVRHLVRADVIPRQEAAEVVQDSLARLIERGLSPIDPPSWGDVYNAVWASRVLAPVGHPDPRGSWRMDATRGGRALDDEVGDLLDAIIAPDGATDPAADTDRQLGSVQSAILRNGDRLDCEIFGLLLTGQSARQAATKLGCGKTLVYNRVSAWRKWVL